MVSDASGRYLVARPATRISLLDVKVLIALGDGRHEHHLAAAQWFVDNAAAGWASCPLTQNGATRLMSTTTHLSGRAAGIAGVGTG